MARRTQREQVKLPPPEQRQRLTPEIVKAGEETENLRSQLDAALEALAELEPARDAAVELDTQRQADALRAGKPDPGRKGAEKAAAGVKAQEPKVKALEVAAGDAERDLEQAIAAVAETARAQLATEADEEREKARAVAEELVAALRARHETLALRAWLNEPSWPYRPGVHGTQLSRFRKPNGEPLSVGNLAAELASALAPPPPPPPEPEPSALRKRPVTT